MVRSRPSGFLLCGIQDALAQEIELGSAVHAALDQLETVYRPVDGTIAPELDDGNAHGGLVLPEPGGLRKWITPQV